MKEVLNQDPGEVAGMLKDPCYTRKELAKMLVTTKRRLEEAQNSRDAAWKEAVEAKEKVGSPQHRASSKEHHAVLYLPLLVWPAQYYTECVHTAEVTRLSALVTPH